MVWIHVSHIVFSKKKKKESCSQKQEEELGYFLREMTCPQCSHNIFTINPKWQVVTSYYC